ncbi:MAG TPA: peptidase M61 [Ignavibacteria bacterium]|nr:peptidase M61 [Ignavibacteria bacterium]
MNVRSFLFITIIAIHFFFSTSELVLSNTSDNLLKANIDLVNIQDDKVRVTITAPEMGTDEAEYNFARIIPGTYAIADYGRYIDNFEAFDKGGKNLAVDRKDTNTWIIRNAKELGTVTYLVNDTYDSESGNAFSAHGTTIFSPAGTNILEGKNFMLNMCGFVGYFSGYKDVKYEIIVSHPADLWGATAMTDTDISDTKALYSVSRFAELVDSPVMFSVPDTSTFKVGDMEVLLSVYSPDNKSITADGFTPDLERMIIAQKTFLGNINKTKKYAVLVYISNGSANDAGGFGALEHNNSTTSVFRLNMKNQELINVISHEFFHTVTPLNIHSKQIQNFDFNDPVMPQHLWMYEGFTEYFAQLFQVNQGLMSEDEFYKVMSGKEVNSKSFYSDNLSFIEISENVLDTNYKAQYPNVYQKGALMAMCLDIIIREKSGGKRGILDLMGQLSEIYGPERPFDASELIPKVTELTYPEVGEFIQNHITVGNPIDYEKYLKIVGVERATIQLPEVLAFIIDKKPYIFIDTAKNTITALKPDGNNFFMALGIKENDQLIEINGLPFDPDNYMSVLLMGYDLEENSPVTMKVKRNGEVIELKGVVKLNYKDGPGFEFKDKSKEELKNAWLKG